MVDPSRVAPRSSSRVPFQKLPRKGVTRTLMLHRESFRCGKRSQLVRFALMKKPGTSSPTIEPIPAKNAICAYDFVLVLGH